MRGEHALQSTRQDPEIQDFVRPVGRFPHQEWQGQPNDIAQIKRQVGFGIEIAVRHPDNDVKHHRKTNQDGHEARYVDLGAQTQVFFRVKRQKDGERYRQDQHGHVFVPKHDEILIVAKE